MGGPITDDEEGPNVVSEEGFRTLLDQGHQAVVRCHAEVEKQGTQWTGRWTVLVSVREGGPSRVLVSHRGQFKPREFKTTLGLIGFIRKMGFDGVLIPLRQGTQAVQPQARSTPPPTDATPDS